MKHAGASFLEIEIPETSPLAFSKSVFFLLERVFAEFSRCLSLRSSSLRRTAIRRCFSISSSVQIQPRVRARHVCVYTEVLMKYVLVLMETDLNGRNRWDRCGKEFADTVKGGFR